MTHPALVQESLLFVLFAQRSIPHSVENVGFTYFQPLQILLNGRRPNQGAMYLLFGVTNGATPQFDII